jgi:hypothetical protein
MGGKSPILYGKEVAVSSGTTFRYDGVPLEDFLECLLQQHKNPQSDCLPGPYFLKEARLDASWRYGVDEPDVPLTLYLLQEKDALTELEEVFLVAHAPGHVSSALRDLAVKLKGFLDHKQVPCYFRIDPRYGLVYGSALEPIDNTIKWDRPGVYVTLCMTADLGAPSLALLEYVAQTQRKLYQDLFFKYNHAHPVSVGFLKSTWKRIRGNEAPDHTPRKLSYGTLSMLATFMSLGLFREAKVSLIYKELPPRMAISCLIDPAYSSSYEAGHDRFFASLGDLA